MEKRRHIWKNIGFAAAGLLLWASARFFYGRILHGGLGGFDGFDVAFVFLPPIIAFFLNWYWMREQRMDALIKWAVSWSTIDLGIFVVAILLLSTPLKQLIVNMQ